jgi:hypothetical protein
VGTAGGLEPILEGKLRLLQGREGVFEERTLLQLRDLFSEVAIGGGVRGGLDAESDAAGVVPGMPRLTSSVTWKDSIIRECDVESAGRIRRCQLFQATRDYKVEPEANPRAN